MEIKKYCDCPNYGCMYVHNRPVDTITDAKQLFLQKTTFKDKFEVVWKSSVAYIEESCDGLGKSVDHSESLRELGNKEYTTPKNEDYLRKSIEAYTKSIACAPAGSNELSLAYANRSAVLFKARLYQDCLLDIERALKSGYPDELKTKLFVRQSLCFKALDPSFNIESSGNAILWLPNSKKNNPNYNVKDEYSKMIKHLEKPRNVSLFSPEMKNKIIVGGSDAIELSKTNDNNQHVVATRDIKSGEFIYLSEPFAMVQSDKSRYISCWHCCRQTLAGIPCDECPNVVFCSPECKEKAWNEYHNLECLVLGQLLKSAKIYLEHLSTVKIFLKAINSAGGLIQLQKKIANIDSMKDEGLIFVNGTLDVNSIDNFHRLDYYKPTSTMCTFETTEVAVWIVTILCKKTNILGQKMTLKNLIKNKNKKIFILGELLLRYKMIVDHNVQTFAVTELGRSVEWSDVVMPFYKILKNSCDPNVDWAYLGSKVGYYAKKPIMQGELLLPSAAGPYYTKSKFDRHQILEYITDDPVPCKCTACTENLPTGQYLPSYQSMMLPTKIEQQLDCMMQTLQLWQDVIANGDTEELLTIKDTLNSMNDEFYKSITGPCREMSLWYYSIRILHSRLHMVHNNIMNMNKSTC
ncbi:SET and MYND domain-containing protein 4-like [Aphidius gifuensis]|uniref:SET and MYND domain-containing protein 4-like n=1 Tax=Aphidius gifuensis TaxID=684658 RepID=UPI001CDBC28F|nr:SET and MYND domain-containing protein 4-like [Aphidius gifuensis]